MNSDRIYSAPCRSAYEDLKMTETIEEKPEGRIMLFD